MDATYFFVIDVGHPPRPPQQVENELAETLAKVRNSASLRAVKVVHGYGSHGRGGSTKETVRNWTFQFHRHFRAAINGEDYDIFHEDTQKMRQACGQIDDTDLGTGNPGITIIWVK